MKSVKALITGITGQDGYYLSKLLLEKGYEVHGTVRRSSSFNTQRIDGLIGNSEYNERFFLHYSDLLDSASLASLIQKIQPDEIYNLAAQSHVAVSFENPIFSTQTSNLGSISILESIKSIDTNIKFYQASSSEMYGGGTKKPLNEESPFDPKSPYAAGKVFAFNTTKLYRESYDMFAVNGILFNHESPLRGETFVTRKITKAVGRIFHKLQNRLTLGNIKAERDWGFAGDYVEAMWLMMQHSEASDWVVSTGNSISVKDFLHKAFKYVDLDPEEYVTTSEKYYRPNEVNFLKGDSTKIQNELNWKPKVDIDNLVKMMVEFDLGEAEKESVLFSKGLIKPTWEYPTE